MSKKIKKQKILMGNEAIGLGIIENGCTVVTSYPGTPASEILTSVSKYKIENNLKIHIEWSVNEKAAFEVALSNSYMGCRSAVAMKQVGLNVASDPLMSSAYTGVIGGFIIISADDPGPHSSQTEQDSRLMAMMAKIPVLDPSSPSDAYQMTRTAIIISEKYQIPVMLRPTTRVCHARQNIHYGNIINSTWKPEFSRNPSRWAATPKYRFQLHKELNQKLKSISQENKIKPICYNNAVTNHKYCIISSGIEYAYLFDLLSDLQLLEQVSLYKTPMPYPLPEHFLHLISKNHEKILILEETDPVIELQLPERKNVFGRLNGFIPKEGEITPDIIYPLINEFLTNTSIKKRKPKKQVGQRPSLCPGCPHRASFFAIKKALPNAIYPSDIGCYTLGINLGAVDTCLCMGASINQASGFYQSIRKSKSKNKPIVATIGDSTFLHSGIPALINSVYNNARFILVILDNHTTAMTGNQPTAATGILPDGTLGTSINIEKLLEGCGIKFIKVIDPYDIPQFISILKDAFGFTTKKDGGIAVIIARHSCLMNKDKPKAYPVTISSECTGCHYCIKNFECPALVPVENQVTINQLLCTGCGVCEYICPIKAIQVKR